MQTDSLYILELIEKITQALKMIRRVSSFMSRQNLLLIYHSLVEQRLNYCRWPIPKIAKIAKQGSQNHHKERV